MPFPRKAKAFISYSHEDEAIRAECVELLRKNHIEAVFDERVLAGQVLDDRIKALIDSCDCLICLGTEASLKKSKWCRREVEYGKYKRKDYYPVIAGQGSPSKLPDWFRGKVTKEHPESVCFKNMEELKEKGCPQIRASGRLPLRWLVVGVFLLLLGGPLAVTSVIAANLPLAGPEIRAAQALIEGINQRIERSRDAAPASAEVLLEPGPDGWSTVQYRDAKTGVVLAKDLFGDDWLQERVYVEGERIIGRDTFSVQLGPEGGVGLLKTREIYLVSGGATIIEDQYDSAGRLVSKRTWSADDVVGRPFGDAGRSVFPVLVPPYR